MAAFEYQYRVKGLYKAPAQVAGEVCEQLAKSETGLTPKALVDASRPKNAPLHGEFDWNDRSAAEKYREVQASGIIRNVILVDVSEEKERVIERSFVSAPGGNNVYVPLRDALNNETWKNHLLEQAHGEMKAFIAKYGRLTKLAGVTDAMQKALDEAQE